uniref:Thrombospondin-like N-terminal domain-containing protein n=1 Tax=Eptatretus burgeri TaxID=7764 RepID=A0A8C4NJD2_EPTBU
MLAEPRWPPGQELLLRPRLQHACSCGWIGRFWFSLALFAFLFHSSSANVDIIQALQPFLGSQPPGLLSTSKAGLVLSRQAWLEAPAARIIPPSLLTSNLTLLLSMRVSAPGALFRISQGSSSRVPALALQILPDRLVARFGAASAVAFPVSLLDRELHHFALTVTTERLTLWSACNRRNLSISLPAHHIKLSSQRALGPGSVVAIGGRPSFEGTLCQLDLHSGVDIAMEYCHHLRPSCNVSSSQLKLSQLPFIAQIATPTVKVNLHATDKQEETRWPGFTEGIYHSRIFSTVATPEKISGQTSPNAAMETLALKNSTGSKESLTVKSHLDPLPSSSIVENPELTLTTPQPEGNIPKPPVLRIIDLDHSSVPGPVDPSGRPGAHGSPGLLVSAHHAPLARFLVALYA